MKDRGLLESAFDHLRTKGEPQPLGALAEALLRTPDSPLARGIAGSLLAKDNRFRVEGGWVRLVPDEVHSGEVPLSGVTFAVLDFETNGFAPGDRAIEIGLSCWRGGVEVASFESLLDPGTGISPFVTRLTGIREEHLAGQPPFEMVLPGLCELLRGAVLVAHNLPFDKRILDIELDRAGGDSRLGHGGICTLRLARKLFPKEEPKGLDALAARFGLTFGARHRALGDARVTGSLLYRLMDLAADSFPMETLAHLRSLACPASGVGVAPHRKGG